jgi:3'-phosphoadenosine 5'-phosphosulfate sulfotransferase (PAPS reductase)/FAD synthetase
VSSTITPDLTAFDVILVNISGGKDSQAMLDVVYREAVKQGVTGKLVTVFCDLGDDDEWPGTKELAAEHAEHYLIRHNVVQRTNAEGEVESLTQHIENRGMWPDNARRYCTSDIRGPVLKLVTRLVRDVREAGLAEGRRVRVLNCMGLRAQESPARAKLAEKTYCLDERSTNATVREVWTWLPIHHMSADEVWEIIREAGTRPHPVYAEGMPRLSCRFCVLASKSALVRAAQLDPEGAWKRALMEERMGHSFRLGLSMLDIIAEAEATPVGTEPVVVHDWAA